MAVLVLLGLLGVRGLAPVPSGEQSAEETAEATGERAEDKGKADQDDADKSGGPSASAGDLLAPLIDEGQGVSTQNLPLGLEEAATQVLDSYVQEGSCALAESGYLDLSCQTWSCVVVGDGWVEVCVVQQEEADSEGSKVWKVHMDAEEWARRYAEMGGEET